jgi:hypothetical protein
MGDGPARRAPPSRQRWLRQIDGVGIKAETICVPVKVTIEEDTRLLTVTADCFDDEVPYSINLSRAGFEPVSIMMRDAVVVELKLLTPTGTANHRLKYIILVARRHNPRRQVGRDGPLFVRALTTGLSTS